MKSVLIVDDSEEDRYIIERIIKKGLKFRNIEVLKDGEDAINYFSNYKKNQGHDTPSLIILDINMPRINGFEFLETFQEKFYSKHKEIIISMLSSSDSPEDREKAMSYPFVKLFLTKPFRESYLRKLEELIK